MKFTSFQPLIVSKNADEIVKLFEALGFEKRHTNANIDGRDITDVTMANPDGFKVDVAQANVERDLTLIRMNVSDFDEAYAFLKERGFTHPSGRIVESKSSRSAMVVSPSGFAFDLCQHIK